MADRKKYILGNWKCNKSLTEVISFFRTFNHTLDADEKLSGCRTIVYGIAPTYLGLQAAVTLKKGVTEIIAQDVSGAENGSYTGQVSATMLKDPNLQIKYCIVGHSETRKFLGVDDRIVNEKVIACLKHNVKPVICIGESLSQYNKKQTKKVLSNQIKTIFKNVSAKDANNCIIAYEPLWAIGTGKTPTLEEVASLCGFIRQTVKSIYNASVCYQMPILYGGSVNENNALDIIKQKDVDGLLIGGASLDPYKFTKIIKDVKAWKIKR